MQWIVMVTSVIASAFISYLIAKKQLNHAIIQEYKAQTRNYLPNGLSIVQI